MIERVVLNSALNPALLWRAAANTATLSVLATGIAVVAARRDLFPALALLALATSLDGVDGLLARRAGGPSLTGALLDVAADWVAFGLAPAALLLSQPRLANPAVWAALSLFLAAALARLLRTCRRFRRPNPVGYTGHPMPANAWALIALGQNLANPALLVLSIVALSALAVSRLPYPSPLWLWHHARLPAALVITLALVAALISPPAALAVLSAAYALAPILVHHNENAAA
jgi:phosphatidylserine synthase